MVSTCAGQGKYLTMKLCSSLYDTLKKSQKSSWCRMSTDFNVERIDTYTFVRCPASIWELAAYGHSSSLFYFWSNFPNSFLVSSFSVNRHGPLFLGVEVSAHSHRPRKFWATTSRSTHQKAQSHLGRLFANLVEIVSKWRIRKKLAHFRHILQARAWHPAWVVPDLLRPQPQAQH